MKYSDLKQHNRIINVEDKASVELTWAGVPELVRSPEGDDGMPLFIEKDRYGRVCKVKDGNICIVRSGMHTKFGEAGAFTRDSIIMCQIPTTISRRHRITAFFSERETFPAVFTDDVILNADWPVRLEYVMGSAALESNRMAKTIFLDDSAIIPDEGSIMIVKEKFDEALADYYTYTFDFITFQVRIVEEQDFIISKRVRIVNDEKGEWSSSVCAKVGDQLEFQILVVNNSESVQKVRITEELPEGLKFIDGEAYLCPPDEKDDRIMVVNEITITGLTIEDCVPDSKVAVYYTARLEDRPLSNNMDRFWNWSDIRIGSRVLQDYAEVIIK